MSTVPQAAAPVIRSAVMSSGARMAREGRRGPSGRGVGRAVGRLFAPVVVLPRRVAGFLRDDPPRAFTWLVVTALCTALGLLWWIGEPMPVIGETFWLAARSGALRSIVWIVAATAVASLTAAWLGGSTLRSRLLIAWLVAALVAGLAMRPQLIAVVRAVFGWP